MEWYWGIPALLVCLAALAVPYALQSDDPFADTGTLLFRLLTTDEVCFAVPAAYFRLVIQARKDEPMSQRAIQSAFVGGVAWWENGERYEALAGVFVATYVFSCDAVRVWTWASSLAWAFFAGVSTMVLVHRGWIISAVLPATGVAAAYLSSLLLGELAAEYPLVRGALARRSRRFFVYIVMFLAGATLLPRATFEVMAYLMPIHELRDAYDMMGAFAGKGVLNTMTMRLMVVTAECQVSLGFLGIALIRSGQARKNSLIKIGDGKMNARAFSHLVGHYMIAVAIPYLLQRTIVENINSYVAGTYRQDLERSLRVNTLFPCKADGMCDTALASVQGSRYTVEGYADSFNAVVSMWYSAIEAKLFAAPKLAMLPGMLLGRPKLVMMVMPLSLALDVGRAKIQSALTKRIEVMHREIQELANQRRKMEQHDTKNEELIRRGAAAEFVEEAWSRTARNLRDKTLRHSALSQFRSFINWLFYQDILGPGIELALAVLLENRYIGSDDIWVYTRVVEETMATLLTRFRMDATLANMRTNINRVGDLESRLQVITDSERPICQLQPSSGSLRVEGLHYTRGPSHSVEIDRLELYPGRIYAVTGANGCGKSSFFGVLASCGVRATKLPDGLNIKSLDSLVIPTQDIVEITQKLYCPLSTRPLAWMLRRNLEDMTFEEVKRAETRASELLRSLHFHSGEGRSGASSEEMDLTEIVDDWYGMLSGGQKIKVEMVQKLFLQERCPGLVLIDEAFAPLDPTSKLAVQKQLKAFCSQSLILAIYHSDASESCITGSFFDDVLHFANGTASVTPRCS